MRTKQKIWTGALVALLCAGVFAADVFKLDFDNDVEAQLQDGTYKRPVPPGGSQFLSVDNGGFKGKGAVFARENLSAFADVSPNLEKPLYNLTYHVTTPFSLPQGTMEFMVKPYFNQISPYPKEASTGFTNYSCVVTRMQKTPAKSPLRVYILGRILTALWQVDDGKPVTVNVSLKDWKPGEWHKIALSWNETTKAVLIDDKLVNSVKAAGKLDPFEILMIGGSYDGCNFQGVIDEFKLSDEALEGITVKNILTEKFPSKEQFEREWELLKMDGAKGSVQFVENEGGGNAVCLTRENADGALVLRRREPLPLKLKTNYRVFGWYHADNMKPDNIGFFRIQQGKDGGLHYNDRFNRGHVYNTFGKLVNQAPGTWDRAIYFYEPMQENAEYYLCYVLRGGDASVKLRDIVIAPTTDSSAVDTINVLPRKPPESLISDAELDAHLAKRKNPEIRIESDAGNNRMFLDGKFQPPLFHRSPPGYPEVGRFGELQRAGVKIHTLTIFVGGIAGGKSSISIIRSKGQYDFAQAIADWRRLLKAAPDAYVLLNFNYGPFPDWTTDGYDEVFQNRKGEYGVSGNLLYVDKYLKNPQEKLPRDLFYPSFYAYEWRDECRKATGAFLEEMKKNGLFKTVAGFFVTGGFDGQFMNSVIDYSPTVRRAFADWLKNKYQTREALQKAWNDPKADFAFTSPSDLPDWPKDQGKRTFLDPKTEMKYADFQEFRSHGILDTLNIFGSNIRKHLPESFPGFISICDDLNASMIDTYSMARLAREKVFNGISPQPKYPLRRDGYIPFNSSVLDSLRYHGKFNILELDLRTYICHSIPSDSRHDFIGWADNPEHFRRINRKLAGMQIAKGHGMWYYDMAGSYFYDEPLLKEIAATAEVITEVQQEKDTFRPDVALVFDEKSVFFNQYRPYPMATFYSANLMQWYTLSSGVPYDILFFEDLLDRPEKIKPYKVIVFLNNAWIDETRSKAIDALKNNNRTLVWMYAPGYVTQQGLSTDSIAKLTGFQVATDPASVRQQIGPIKSANPLTRNLEPVLGLTEMMRCNADYPGSGYGKKFDMQRFTLEGNDFEPLATYTADGKAAVGVKAMNGWKSIYVANPSGLTSQLLNNIAVDAGAYVLTSPGVVSSVRGNFISLHALKGGAYELKLPKNGRVVSVESGKILNSDGGRISVEIPAGDTRWFRIYEK